MSNFNDSTANTHTAVSVISAIASIAAIMQPIISLVAAIVAVISGTMAARYYWHKTKVYAKRKTSNKVGPKTKI